MGTHGTSYGLSDKTDREGTTIINDDTISVSIDTVKPSDGWKFTDGFIMDKFIILRQ